MPMIDLRQDAAALADDLIALRRRLHAIPEIGLQLPATQREVLSALDGLPLEISTGRACTSVTAVLRGGAPHEGTDRPVVLLRGDMDALPVRETTGVPFAPAAESPHADAMHACGHDLHMAGLVGAARLLSARRDDLPGDVVFMFQPGEEGHDGAGVMIGEGVLDAAGRRADAAFGLHVFSAVYPNGAVAARPGPLMAASSGLHVRVIGAGGHGSMPYRAKDPIAVAAEMVTALQTLATRQFDIFDPIVITVGSFHGGTRRNVIPDDAVFEATIRTFSAQAAQRAQERTVRLCRGIADAYGLTAEVRFDAEYPVTVNDPGQYAFAAGVATDLFGPDRVIELPSPIPGSEDFSRVLEEVPGAYLFLGATTGDPVTAPSNHSPQATFDDAVLPDAAALLATLGARALADLAGSAPAAGESR
jgi:hippurate hydrolase